MPGKPVADAVFANLEPRIAALRASGHNPGLGTILVGGDSASAGYIRMKQEMAASLGFGGRHVQLPGDASQADLIGAIPSRQREAANLERRVNARSGLPSLRKPAPSTIITSAGCARSIAP
mgnify:CR=1 FL=1